MSWEPVVNLANSLHVPIRPTWYLWELLKAAAHEGLIMKLLNKRTGRILFLLGTLLAGLVQSSHASDVKEHLLSNGLKVLLLESSKAPVVTVQLWYKVGSRNEIMGRAGLSHMLEHMMFKGTPRFPKGSFSKIVRKNGGNDNAFTGQDFTAYFENLAADRVALALELEADRLRGLLLDEKEFFLEREVVKEERRLRIEDDPQSYLV